MPKLDPEVYRKAARRIADGQDQFTCHAVWRAGARGRSGTRGSAHREAYIEHFYHPVWANGFWNKDPTPRRQALRVLALCFMAAIVEDENGASASSDVSVEAGDA